MSIDVIRGFTKNTNWLPLLNDRIPLRRTDVVEYIRECTVNANYSFDDMEIEYDSELVLVLTGEVRIHAGADQATVTSGDLVELVGYQSYAVKSTGADADFIQFGLSRTSTQHGS